MVERLKSDEEVEIRNCEEYFTSLLHRAGSDEKAKILKVRIASSEYAVKEAECSLEEAEYEQRCLQVTLKSKKFTKAELKTLSKYQKKLSKSIRKLAVKVKRLSRELKQDEVKSQQKKHRNKIAFILISSKLTRDKILSASTEAHQRGLWIWNIFKKKSYMELKAAPDPSELLWKNIGQPRRKQRTVHILLLILSGLIFMSLVFLNNSIIDVVRGFLLGNDATGSDNRFEYGPFWSFVLFTSIEINFFIGKKIIYKLSSYSLFVRKDTSSWMRAAWLGFLKYFTLGTLSAILFSERKKTVILVNLRLLRIVFNQLRLQAIMRVLRLKHISKFYKMIKYWILSHRRGKLMMTQKQLNLIFEKPKFEVEVMYSINMYVLIIMLCYSYYIPLIPVLCYFYFIANILIDRLLYFRFYAEPTQKKRNMAIKCLLSNGFILKLWYLNILRVLLNLGFVLDSTKIRNEGLRFWFWFLVYFCIALLSFPFEFLLKLELKYLQQRDIDKRAQEEDISDSLEQSLSEENQKKSNNLHRSGLSDEELVRKFESEYGYHNPN